MFSRFCLRKGCGSRAQRFGTRRLDVERSQTGKYKEVHSLSPVDYWELSYSVEGMKKR